jgi:hypothetical protein
MARKIRGSRMIKITLAACGETPSPVKWESKTRKTAAGDILKRPVIRDSATAGIRRSPKPRITIRSLFVYSVIS